MSVRSLLFTSIFLTFVNTLSAHAQKAQGLDVTINEADGDVEIMLPNTFQWIPAPSEAGSIFSEGTQIRTGPFSSMTLVFADSSVVMVDSFTFMTVEKFFKTGNVVTTRLNLIVGSIGNTINEGTPFKNDFKIATPSFTASLREGEIKKIVAGAMFKDTVITGFRENGKAASTRTDYGMQESAGEIAREVQRQRESSVAP
jgi:hypothetical protein